MFTSEELKAEIVNDPAGLGYKKAMTANDWLLDNTMVNLINQKTTTLTREKIKSTEIRALIGFEDYIALDVDQRDWIKFFVIGDADLTLNIETIKQLSLTASSGGIWKDNSTMPEKIIGLLQYVGSRAQQLWGQETVITESDISRAFKLSKG